MAKYKNGTFYQLPKDLHKVIGNCYEFAVLSYLLQCSNNGQAFPSYNTMAQGMMSRRKAMSAEKALESKGYITKEPRAYKSNIYRINIDQLVYDIHQCMTFTSEPHSPSSEPHSPPSEPHSPAVVNDMHPNNNKLNNTKEQKQGTRIKDTHSPQKPVLKNNYGIDGLVNLTDAEYQKLLEKFGAGGLKAMIDKLAAYIGSSGKQYKSHYHTILKWELDTSEQGKSSKLPKRYTLPDELRHEIEYEDDTPHLNPATNLRKKGKNAGVNRINSDDPDKYIKGKYGHMVQR